MATATKTPAARKPAKAGVMLKSAKAAAAPKPVKSAGGFKPAKAAAARLSLKETMSALEKAGSEQTRKTYTRHGAAGPMFGVSFATLKTLLKRIRVDHELALALWETGNLDARNLAVKIADPAIMSRSDLDRWATAPSFRVCGAYVGHLAVEGPHGRSRADAWRKASDEATRSAGWTAVGALAMRDEDLPDAWFAERLAEIEKSIHASQNNVRYTMLCTIIAIGSRSPSLRKAAIAAGKRIGTIDIDVGDTECKMPEIGPTLEKSWAYANSKGFASPAAAERNREPMRTRC